MDAIEITETIRDEIDKVMALNYTKLYVNVDDLENGFGFLRVLAMKGYKDIIVYEGTFPIDVCYRVLDLLAQSNYQIKDFTMRR